MQCQDDLNITAEYNILYAITGIEDDCPDPVEERVIESAMGRLLSDGREWCSTGTACPNSEVCAPVFDRVTATIGERNVQPINEFKKKCLVRVTVTATIKCECKREIDIGLPTISQQKRCGPDVTDWFLWEINLHTAFFKGTEANEPAKLVAFGQYARRIAYKYLRFTSTNCPTQTCVDTVMLCNQCINVSELGNIMFGAVGMLWFGRESIIIAGGNSVASSSTGGINSVQDMAGVFAGLQIGKIIRRQPGMPDLSKDVLCSTLQTLDPNLRDGLVNTFGEPTRQLIADVGNNPLSAMATTSCDSCDERIGILAPHSDFSWVRGPADYLRLKNTDWWKTYDQMNSGGIDNSRIPRNQ